MLSSPEGVCTAQGHDKAITALRRVFTTLTPLAVNSPDKGWLAVSSSKTLRGNGWAGL